MDIVQVTPPTPLVTVNSNNDVVRILSTRRTIRSGEGVPSSSLGSDGDFYIDTETHDIYGPKAGGSWGSATSLIGPPGPGGGTHNPAITGIYYAESDLAMVPSSRSNADMDANKTELESVWNHLKTRRGRVQLGPYGYWIRNPIATYSLDGQSLFGTGGIGFYTSESAFNGGTDSRPAGAYSRIVAGADDMASLLDITGYGWRIQDVTFQGSWSQNGTTGFRLPDDLPTTGILVRSNPASVTPTPSYADETIGTGKMIFDGLCFYGLKNGITFGGSSPAPGLPSENNADNCHFTRTEAQFLEEFIYRFKSKQSVVFTAEQTQAYYCGGVAFFEYGGHADLGLIEVVEGNVNQLLTGTTAPSNSIGFNGDFYRNTATSQNYIKANDAWALATGTVLVAASNPAALSDVGDYFLNTATNQVFVQYDIEGTGVYAGYPGPWLPKTEGTSVLRLGDPRENENTYKINVRLDNTSKLPGLKVIKIDSPAYGTIIDCFTSFGYDYVKTYWARNAAEGGTDTVHTGSGKPSNATGSNGDYYRNTVTGIEYDKSGGEWSIAGRILSDDVFDLYGACSVTLRGGPYYPKCLRLRSSESRYPNVHFPSGTVFQAGTTPDFCVNLPTSSGTWKVTWGDCVDVNGVAIPAGEMTN